MRIEPENPSENLNESSINYEFGPFRLHPGDRLLLCDGKAVVLPTKAFETLLILVKNRGRLVTKNEFLQTLWPNTFVEEGNLTQHISILRKALGGNHNGGQYIRTVPKGGYRFVAEVIESYARPNLDVPVDHDQKVKSPARRKILFAVASVTFAAAVLFYFVWNRPQDRIDSIAVLPFTVVSPEPQTEYLADGIAESIINDLAALPNLKVASFDSVAPYKGKQFNDLHGLAKHLGVRAILSTRVTQWGDELFISAELMDTNDYRRPWTRQYKRALSNIIGLQEEVAKDISDELRMELTTEEQRRVSKRYTENAEAYRLYLEGRYFWNKRTAEGRKKAIDHFQKAIDADPNYALAYSGLADAHLLGFVAIPPSEHMPKAREAAMQALRLDESLADAHTSLGLVKARFEWDWEGAENEFKRAIELNPSYATAHERYARFLMWVSRKQEAEREILRAQQLDPLSLIISTNVGEIFHFARDYDRTIVEVRKVLEMDPNFQQARWRLAEAYEGKGMHPEALAEYLKWMSLSGMSPANVDAVRRAYDHSGMNGLWEKLIALAEHDNAGFFISSRKLAAMYARIGKNDKAIALLEDACREHDLLMVELNVDPAFDGLRLDSRFARLLHDIGLAD